MWMLGEQRLEEALYLGPFQRVGVEPPHIVAQHLGLGLHLKVLLEQGVARLAVVGGGVAPLQVELGALVIGQPVG